VRQVLDEWLEEHATIARPGAHVLRHTCLTGLVRRGTDLVTVAELAGHSHVENDAALQPAQPSRPPASRRRGVPAG
jgi:site-specific recombinase XerD